MRVDEMKFLENKLAILITLCSMILFSTVFANHDFAQTEKEEVSSTIRVEYLGSVPIESSLTDFVPGKDKQMVGLKERWLESIANLLRRARLAVSENGKYKVVGTAPDQKSEGVVKATFIDSNGAEIWNAVVGYVIYVSNNGRNIAATSPLSDRISFYDVRTSTEPTSTAKVDGRCSFSYNGEYFVSAGQRLVLRRSDGTLVWEKDTGTPASKKVAISADGSYVVMASSSVFGEPEPNITEVTGLEEEKQPEYSFPPKSVMDERLDGVEAWKKQAEEEGNRKPPQMAKRPKTEKKVYLSFLKGDGTLINQTAIRLRVAQNLVMSRDGIYVALSCDSTLLFYQTETGTLLWQKIFPTVYWWMKSMAMSRNGNIIALGVRPDRGDRYSPPHLYVLGKDGLEIGSFQLESPLPRESPPPLHYGWGPIVDFAEDGGHILMATYARKHLFKIAEVGR